MTKSMQMGWLVHLGEKLEKLKEREEGKYKLGENERTREVEVTRFSTHGKVLGQSLERCLFIRL